MAEIEQLYKRAEEAFQKHSYDYARDLFLQILQLNPDHAQSRKALRVTIRKKFEEQGGPGKLKLTMLRGQVELTLKTTKDPQRKLEICQKHLSEDPEYARVRIILAENLLSLNLPNGAAVEAEMAMETDTGKGGDTGRVAAAKILVAAYKSLGKVKEAQAALDRVTGYVKDDRELERLHRDLAAMETMRAGFEEAKTFRDVVKDKDVAAKLEAQSHLIQTDEQFDAVMKDLARQLAESPTDPKVPKKIADLYFDRRKDYATAKEYYKKASALAPQDTVLRDKVEDCALREMDVEIESAAKANDPKLAELKAGRLKFLISTFERRVKDRPTDMVLRFELGKGYYQAGPAFLDKAIGEFQQSVKDPKRKPDSHLYLGLAFQSKRLYDMADTQYAHAEEGVLSQDRRMMILYNRAKCLAESGNLPKAVELGKRIMETDIGFKDVSELVEKWQNGENKLPPR